ncbi:MAG: hypothetical protein P4L33_21870 [Capsulimonadaceae bacterium]|nr:hypothetical protein [Capsulimonadaceae bacterium]
MDKFTNNLNALFATLAVVVAALTIPLIGFTGCGSSGSSWPGNGSTNSPASPTSSTSYATSSPWGSTSGTTPNSGTTSWTTSSTSGTPSTTTITISGTVTGIPGSPAGWNVQFDYGQYGSTYQSAITSSGTYSLTIPVSAETASNNITIADPNGAVWFWAVPITAGAYSVSENITLPAYNTISGTITLHDGAPAVNYAVQIQSANKQLRAFWWPSYTNAAGQFTLYVPISIVNGSVVNQVVTGNDWVYVNSYPNATTMDEWTYNAAPMNAHGGHFYTYNPILPGSPIDVESYEKPAGAKPNAYRAAGLLLARPSNLRSRGSFVLTH